METNNTTKTQKGDAMKTVKISATELAKTLLANQDKIGSTDWDVYAHIDDGRLDVRHNTHSNDEWIEIYDFYSAYDEIGEDVDSLAQWLTTDGLPAYTINENISDDIYDDEKITVKYI